MTTAIQGQDVELRSTFFDAPGGSPIDPTSVSLSITRDGALVAGPFTYPSTIEKDAVGLYRYTWSVPSGSRVDTYVAAWTAVINGVTSVGYEEFRVVEAQTTISGVSVSDVDDLTAVAIGIDTLKMAVSVLELFASVDLSDFDRFDARDRRWLRDAVCWQAAWLDSQPDYVSRSDFASMSQDGLSLTTRNQASLMLAPLARKALSRVSWARARSVRLGHGAGRTAMSRTGAPVYDTDADVWEAL